MLNGREELLNLNSHSGSTSNRRFPNWAKLNKFLFRSIGVGSKLNVVAHAYASLMLTMVIYIFLTVLEAVNPH
ncbi:hypothetical protein JD844_020808 [Phrynosoma platyrhinos]|uniref:Uncharacterized protein n=1 Tax=Phrynosoma platyrhinos TaxID=52577 RepID=A0ABQ7SSV1_PHRPL|nr:hypothetical protein JD844_020808 [Phrynosoma platyrhinos]